MTKKLEELFNLDSAEPEKVVEEIPPVATHEEVNSLDEQYVAVQNIVSTLPQIQELENLDEKALDDLATKAEQAYDDLMDLGMNVEVRYASRIFEVASSMMGNAITTSEFRSQYLKKKPMSPEDAADTTREKDTEAQVKIVKSKPAPAKSFAETEVFPFKP